MGLSDRPVCRHALDVLLAAGVAAFATIAALLSTQGTRDLDARGHAMLLVASFALVARRRFPVAVLVVTAWLALWYQARGYPGMMTTLPVPFAVYSAVSAGRRRATLIGLGGVVAVVSLLASVVPHMTPVRELAETKFVLLGWFLAGGVLAEVSLHRRAYVEQVEQRALEAERSREETARRRASEERLRIARDLHDSLTHSISIIKVQAGVAAHLARKKGEEVPASLQAIEAASADAIRELRSTLEVLRQPGVDPNAAGETTAGLDLLDALVERTRTAAGVPTTLRISGARRDVPAPVDAAAYRIIQESLTNVARHAGADARAVVELRYGPDAIDIRVVDDGRARAGHDPIPGVGLIGMRERVTGLGGHLRAGPREEGGFSVAATLPLPTGDATAVAAARATAPDAADDGGTGTGRARFGPTMAFEGGS